MWALVWTCTILCGLLLRATDAQTGIEAKELRKKLFVTDEYDKKVRTASDQADPTEVQVSFFLTNLNSVDVVNEVIRTTGYLSVEWRDDFLDWTPGDYGGIEYSYWPQDDVWKPDIALKNSYQDYKELGDSALNVQVYFDGGVTWSPFRVFESTCTIDIKYFPYDIQRCKLIFVAWSYTKADVYMQAGSRGIDLENFQGNSEWDIIGSTAKVEEETSEASVIFTLVIRRKPKYILLTIFLPILLLMVLNLCVFLLPCECGEKASYAITVFLAFAVFLTIVSSKLPENSESTSIMSIYILLQTVQSTVITFVALLFVRLHSLDSSVPRWLRCLVSALQCRCCKRSKVQHCESDTIAAEQYKKQNETGDQEDSMNGSASNHCSWKKVINCLDYVCFAIFLLIGFVSTTVCMVILATSSNKYSDEFLSGAPVEDDDF